VSTLCSPQEEGSLGDRGSHPVVTDCGSLFGVEWLKLITEPRDKWPYICHPLGQPATQSVLSCRMK
jgi:hypothetical protein